MEKGPALSIPPARDLWEATEAGRQLRQLGFPEPHIHRSRTGPARGDASNDPRAQIGAEGMAGAALVPGAPPLPLAPPTIHVVSDIGKPWVCERLSITHDSATGRHLRWQPLAGVRELRLWEAPTFPK